MIAKNHFTWGVYVATNVQVFEGKWEYYSRLPILKLNRITY